METTFKKYSDAADAGFTVPLVTERYRGFIIKSTDTSGSNAYGYSYAIIACTDDSILDAVALYHAGVTPIRECFGRTREVWLSEERNQIHQPGCFVVRYAPGIWAAGVQAAKRAVDDWYKLFPEAAEMHMDWALWRVTPGRLQSGPDVPPRSRQ